MWFVCHVICDPLTDVTATSGLDQPIVFSPFFIILFSFFTQRLSHIALHGRDMWVEAEQQSQEELNIIVCECVRERERESTKYKTM